MFVLPRFEAIIPLLPVFLLDNKNFLFYPTAQTNLRLLAYIIDYKTIKILIKNTFDWLVRILYYHKLGYVVDISHNNCFFADAKFTLHLATFFLQTLPFFEYELSYTTTPADSFMKTKLGNRVKVYRNKHVVTLLAQLSTKYFSIEKSKSFVQILPDC